MLLFMHSFGFYFFFFFNDTATTEIYTLSLHDALPISEPLLDADDLSARLAALDVLLRASGVGDRKSTRLTSSHQLISYAVFCLKKKRASSPSRCRTRTRRSARPRGRRHTRS